MRSGGKKSYYGKTNLPITTPHTHTHMQEPCGSSLAYVYTFGSATHHYFRKPSIAPFGRLPPPEPSQGWWLGDRGLQLKLKAQRGAGRGTPRRRVFVNNSNVGINII